MIKVAINGFGRIGRNVLRALYENDVFYNNIKIVAINDLADIETNAHLLKYDSTHGMFLHEIECNEKEIIINKKDKINMYSEKSPLDLPWAKIDVDIVLECTGLFTNREDAEKHINAGAKKVIISAPAKNPDKTIVVGVNNNVLTKEDKIISNASCTTNCLATVLKVLNDSFGFKKGMMTTIHSFTGDQRLVDTYHKDLYRARGATQSMIPTTTGAARSIALVIPELKGKIDGLAIRVPTPNVSLVDLTCEFNENVSSIEEVKKVMKRASENEMEGTLDYSDKKLVSVDFNHNSHSAIFIADQVYQEAGFFKILAWYDNEWGFSNRMLDLSLLCFDTKPQ